MHLDRRELRVDAAPWLRGRLGVGVGVGVGVGLRVLGVARGRRVRVS